MRRIFTFFLTFLLGMFVTALYAQTHTVSGTVIDKDANEPLIGANVLIKGTTIGTVTDLDGKYTLQAGDKDILVFSYLSMKTIEEPVNGRTVINVKMTSDTETLGEVVVTAMGIKRQSETLTYSAQTVGGKDVNDIKSVNMINSLQGKSAGMMITPNSTGAGGSSKILFRGNKSISGNNQPLVVVDGVPVMMNITNSQVDSNYGGQRDGGDAMSTINPDDIAQITLLKGASAAALYGAVAANGAIMITTKSAQSGKVSVNVSSNTTMESPMVLPEFQTTYGMSDNGTFSWGEKLSSKAPNYAKKFFRTGFTTNNSISLSGGNENIQSYFSYANVYSQGITPQNDYRSHNLNSKVGFNILKDIHIDFTAKFTNQHITNQAAAGYLWNPLTGVYLFPRGEDWNGYNENFEVYDEGRNLNIQNWHTSYEDFEQNPYWITNRILSKENRMHVIVSLSANLKINDWLSLQTRGNVDYINDKVRQQFYASTAPALAGANGRYIEMDYQETQYYGDAILMMKKQWDAFSLNAALGASINDKTVNSTRYDSKTASLKYANVFNLANIIMNGSAGLDQKIDARRQLQSLFATAQLGYNEFVYLDLSARNDWSSTLAYTSHEKSGFFYPSVGFSLIFNKLMTLPRWVSLAKIRGAYSMVGNDIPMFITNPSSHITAGGEFLASDAAPFKDMEPEMTHSFEAGIEARFLKNRIGLNATFYKTNTRNQFFKLPTLSGDKYAYRYVNAGNIQNVGWEVSLDAVPLLTNHFKWKTEVNFSTNRNKIISLHEALKEFLYGPTSFSSSYAMKLVKGGSIGDIYGKAFVRDDAGNIVYGTEGDNTGMPLVEGDGNTVKVGNANPKLMLGWNHMLSYKNFSFYFLVDCRFGGDILSQTQADMDMYGVSEVTARARDKGYVMLEGNRIDNVKGFYKNVVGGRAGVTEYYMYDATNIRLRELSVGYQLPAAWMEKTKVLKRAQLSFSGRNLFFFYKKAPFDPDLVLSTGNDNQGIEVYGMPTTRSWGFSLKCEF